MQHRNVKTGGKYVWIVYIILGIISVFFLVPFVTMVLNAFKFEHEILGYPPTFFPKVWTLENYRAVLSNESVNLLNALKNSVFITVTRAVLVLYFAALWGYTLCKIKFKGRNFLFYLILSAMMVPVAVILLPLFQEMVWFGWYGSHVALILVVNSTTSYAVFLMRQFITNIPNEIIESSYIDGCGEFQVFHRIVFPLLKNAVSAISIIVFLYIWNDFLWPFMMLNDPSKFTVTVAMQFLNGKNFIRYGQLMAATSISILPIVVVYFIFQNRFTQGISMSGLKE